MNSISSSVCNCPKNCEELSFKVAKSQLKISQALECDHSYGGAKAAAGMSHLISREAQYQVYMAPPYDSVFFSNNIPRRMLYQANLRNASVHTILSEKYKYSIKHTYISWRLHLSISGLLKEKNIPLF